MQYVTYILTGGFLKGYRTAVIAVATIGGIMAQLDKVYPDIECSI